MLTLQLLCLLLAGFTQPAITKAKMLGIEIRKLGEVSEDALSEWARTTQIVVVQGQFGVSLTRLKLKPTMTNSNPALAAHLKAECAKGHVDFRFIQRNTDKNLISIGDVP